ncbi:30S ribosomal protein S2 [Candidatus Gracilibacteria bacterium]|nr:30S ribosomal protein S2 [Candidatus Gracilibacteria bacterium]MCF7819760.1 30S ribosomal protein S2 [Candidatus Gracilibacteria bacterium]
MATIKDLFKNLIHIGQRTERWNPKMNVFLHGKKNGVHILNLEKTLEKLEEAKKFLAATKLKNGKVLFVGTKPQSALVLREKLEGGNQFFVDEKWAPGLLTNFNELRKRVDYYLNLKSQFESGEIKKYTKKEIARFKKELGKLDIAYHGVAEMRKKPAVLVVLDAVVDRLAIEEANRVKIPVVALVDSNADPDGIAYPIPANDDAVKSIRFLVGELLDSLK